MALVDNVVNSAFASKAGATRSGVSPAWLEFFRKLGNGLVIPGPYADDTAAAAAGVAIGSPYYLPSGAVMIRLV